MHGFQFVAAFVSQAVDWLHRAHAPEAATFLVAAAFVLSGWAKTRRPLLAALAVVEFGVLKRASPVVGLTVGLAEIALGVALVLSATRVVAQGAAVLLLWTFVAILARQIILHRDAPCFCFGQADEALTWSAVVRTGGLAVAVTYATLASLVTASASTSWTVLTLSVVSAVALLASYALMSQLPRLATRHEHAPMVLGGGGS